MFTSFQQQRLLNNYVDFLGLNHYSTRYFSNAAATSLVTTTTTTTTNTLLSEKKVIIEQGWGADQHTVESKYDMNGNLIGPQGRKYLYFIFCIII